MPMMSIAILLAAAAPDCRDLRTQADMTRCAVADFQREDAALNRQWLITLAAVRAREGQRNRGDTRPGDAAALLDAQRAWLRFRDAHCLVEGFEMRGGSGEPMLAAGCRARLTRERTAQLRALAATR